MCGRFTLRTPAAELTKFFHFLRESKLTPRYNIAPTQPVLAVRAGDDGREAGFLKWGLIPKWAKDPSIGARMINARAETVAEKTSFRAAFKRRRCLIPADGFYEWKRVGKVKQPYLITLHNERPFAFAGLWERWQGIDGAAVDSCTIITTEANDLVRGIHARMPVILSRDAEETWLFGSSVDAQRALVPYPHTSMRTFPVSRRLNSPSHDDPTVLEPDPIQSIGFIDGTLGAT